MKVREKVVCVCPSHYLSLSTIIYCCLFVQVVGEENVGEGVAVVPGMAQGKSQDSGLGGSANDVLVFGTQEEETNSEQGKKESGELVQGCLIW